MSAHPTSDDRELARWQEQWRAAAPEVGEPRGQLAHEVRRAVTRRARRLRRWWWAETVIAALAAGLIAWAFAILPHALDRIAMAELLLIVVGAWLYGWWTWRGQWAPAAETTTAYLALRRQHLERSRRAVRAGWVVLALFVAAYAPWIYHRSSEGGAPSWPHLRLGYGLLALLVVPYVVALPLLARRLERERGELVAAIDERDEC